MGFKGKLLWLFIGFALGVFVTVVAVVLWLFHFIANTHIPLASL